MALRPHTTAERIIVYEHIEDVLHTYITEFFTTNNRQSEATTPPPPAEQQPLLFATDDEENAKIKELLAALDEAKITDRVLNTKRRNRLNIVIAGKFREWKKNKELTYFNAEAAFRFVQKAGLEYNGKTPRTWPNFIRKLYNE